MNNAKTFVGFFSIMIIGGLVVGQMLQSELLPRVQSGGIDLPVAIAVAVIGVLAVAAIPFFMVKGSPDGSKLASVGSVMIIAGKVAGIFLLVAGVVVLLGWIFGFGFMQAQTSATISHDSVAGFHAPGGELAEKGTSK